ncbi:MAG: triple tyrosine motif-containing protein, partial [Bacteroidota bacterium]
VYRLLPLGPAYYFAPVYNGFALRSAAQQVSAGEDFTPLIRAVEAFNNDTLRSLTRGEKVPHPLHNLRVRFLVPQREDIRYQYQLEGLGEEWSQWSSRTEAEFLDLSAGDYVFRVRAEAAGKVTAPASFAFTVAPPWYQSWWAIAGYLGLAGCLLFLNYWWQRRRLRAQRRELLEQEQAALSKQAVAYQRETLVIKLNDLENELLDGKRQLRLKTIELAKKARESEEKTRLLRTVQARIKSLGGASAGWSRLHQLLEDRIGRDDQTFDLQMEELNRDFLTALQERYPELTTYDARLCLYLRTGLSSREIADILNVLPSSVNVSRSRLRKKLGLNVGEDLTKFLHALDR